MTNEMTLTYQTRPQLDETGRSSLKNALAC